jgi:hypothetical protein
VLNEVIRYVRGTYLALYPAEVNLAGIAQTAPGYVTGNTNLLRNLRQCVVFILHSAGVSLEETLVPPQVQYVNPTHLRLSHGREIFPTSPFPENMGQNQYRVTRQTTDFGFDETPADGNYEVILIPSYSGHSYLDPFIRLAGTTTMPADDPVSSEASWIKSISVQAATFTVTSGAIDETTLVNVPNRPVSGTFTDPLLTRSSFVFPKEIHYRELAILTQSARFPEEQRVIADLGSLAVDPQVLPSVADQDQRPKGYASPSNLSDPIHSDIDALLSQSIGEVPPPATPVTRTVRGIVTPTSRGEDFKDETQWVPVRCGIGSIRVYPFADIRWMFNQGIMYTGTRSVKGVMGYISNSPFGKGVPFPIPNGASNLDIGVRDPMQVPMTVEFKDLDGNVVERPVEWDKGITAATCTISSAGIKSKPTFYQEEGISLPDGVEYKYPYYGARRDSGDVIVWGKGPAKFQDERSRTDKKEYEIEMATTYTFYAPRFWMRNNFFRVSFNSTGTIAAHLRLYNIKEGRFMDEGRSQQEFPYFDVVTRPPITTFKVEITGDFPVEKVTGILFDVYVNGEHALGPI